MRTIVRVVLLAGAAGAVACSRGSSDQRANGDLNKDLELAVQAGSNTQVVSSIEQMPSSAPAQRQTPRPKPAPEHHIAPKPVTVGQVDSTAVAMTQAPSTSAPATVSTPINQGGEVASAPRPTPVPVAYPGAGGGYGGIGCNGMCRGGGGGVTVIIRGGHAGDGDNCEPQGRPRGGGIISEIPMIVIHRRR